MSNLIQFLKTRKVKSPNKAHATDAGIDFYVPEFLPQFIKDLGEKNKTQWMGKVKILNLLEDNEFELPPQERVLIPSGIHCKMQNNRCLIAFNKSGVASKLGLIVGSCVVDEGYEGEIHISLINTSTESVKISAGMKAVQFIETPVYHSDIEITENKTLEEFYQSRSDRGEQGFGSTDHK